MRHSISERQLNLMPRWSPDEPFADLLALEGTLGTSSHLLEAAMTTRLPPRRESASNWDFTAMPRLRFRKIYVGPKPTAVVLYKDGADWLRALDAVRPDGSSLPVGMEFGLMQHACWRTACRVTRGTRSRSVLAAIAFREFEKAWPEDHRVCRQPGYAIRAMQAIAIE